VPGPDRLHVEGDYRGVVRDVKRTGAIVTKRATAGRAKLLGEAAWLQRLPEDLRDHFPQVLGIRSGPTWAEYDMPWYAWPNLSDLLLNAHISAEDAATVTLRIVEFAVTRLHTWNVGPAPPDFFVSNYLEKIERRICAADGVSRVFDRLVDQPFLVVGGRRVESPMNLVRHIRANEPLLAELQAPRLGLVHGDFKLDNFLVDLSSRRFLLIDPRGVTFSGESTGDYLEDIAKLRTSTLGHYDVIRRGDLRVLLDGRRVVRTLDRTARPTARLLAELDNSVLDRLSALVDANEDPHWRTRLRFLTPLLLVANAPFQLAPANERNEAVAVSLYVVGAELLQAAFDTLASR
jgi:Phosphotransferase enzyme family